MEYKRLMELAYGSRKKLSNSNYLTPSKLNLFIRSLDHFISRYYLHEKDDDSPAMKRGSHIHNLVYFYLFSEWSLEQGGDCYQLHDPFIVKPDFLATAPAFIKKSANQPISVKEQREIYLDRNTENFKRMAESNSQMIIEEKDLRIIKALKAHYFNNGFLKQFSRKDYEIETLVENKENFMGGYVDLMNEDYIVDIKTTSTDFSNANDFLKYNIDTYAYQQIIYQDCVNTGETNKEFVFVLIQLIKPYKIVSFKLPDTYVDQLRAKFYHRILPAYKKLQAKLGWRIDAKEQIIGDKEAVFDVYEALIKEGFYTPEIEDVTVNHWKQRDLTREISMYKDAPRNQR